MLASARSGLPAMAGGLARLFLEIDDPHRLVDRHDAEIRGLVKRHLDAGDGAIGTLGDMVGQHVRIVHLVDVIAGQDDEVFGPAARKMSKFWNTASAVPRYQVASSSRCCAGNRSRNSPISGRKNDQPICRWRNRLCALYWVRTAIRRTPELRQFDRVKSMIRNLPPKNTAGLARRSVSCFSRLPRPPARTSAERLPRQPLLNARVRQHVPLPQPGRRGARPSHYHRSAVNAR